VAPQRGQRAGNRAQGTGRGDRDGISPQVGHRETKRPRAPKTGSRKNAATMSGSVGMPATRPFGSDNITIRATSDTTAASQAEVATATRTRKRLIVHFMLANGPFAQACVPALALTTEMIQAVRVEGGPAAGPRSGPRRLQRKVGRP